MREQLELVGPRSLGVALLTASFVGMVFTIQVPPPPLSAPYPHSQAGLPKWLFRRPAHVSLVCVAIYLQRHPLECPE